MNKPIVYTIGHSTHPAEKFLDLLKTFGVNCVIDVRSLPASRFNPQYNKAALNTFLNTNSIKYLHFGEEFGARQTDSSVLDEDGKVDFELVRRSVSFKKGIERLKEETKDHTVALMCSESEPLDCHRFSMISVALQENGFDIQHILKDKTLRSNVELEEQLLKKYESKFPLPDIFHPDITIGEKLKMAYRLKNKEIGFSPLP